MSSWYETSGQVTYQQGERKQISVDESRVRGPRQTTTTKGPTTQTTVPTGTKTGTRTSLAPKAFNFELEFPIGGSFGAVLPGDVTVDPCA